MHPHVHVRKVIHRGSLCIRKGEAMELIRVCISNLWALQERRYAVVYVAVTKFVRTMLRLILLSTPRYF